MTLYCGIDLHSNNSVISLIDETDQLISEKRLDNNLEAIAHHLFRSMVYILLKVLKG